jgi:hypothetical protein
MNEATIAALTAYLVALKNDGFTHIHMTNVIPAHHPMTSLERREAGLPYWTQFPDIAFAPETGIFYHRSSGMVFFDEAMYKKVAG